LQPPLLGLVLLRLLDQSLYFGESGLVLDIIW